MKKWYEKSRQEADVVISTCVRLARNLSDYPSPVKMTAEQREKVGQAVRDAVMHGNGSISNDLRFISLDDISQNEAVSLVERHLVSPEFISAPNGRGPLLTQDKTASVIINEGDYLWIQVMCKGLDLEGVCEMVDRVDALLNESLHFAFDEGLGYPTQCPTNLGTGMWTSLMLHLPAFQESGAMHQVASNLSKLGLVIRGIYGEGSEPVGAIYQLSDQVTLGLSEQFATVNLESIAGQLIAQERTARAEPVKTVETQDQIPRSIGALKNARALSSDEFMRLTSYVRVGAATEFLTGISYDTIDSLIVQVQSATMMPIKKMTTAERDAFRASIVSQRLNVI